MNSTQKQFSYFAVLLLTLLAYWSILRSPLLYVDDAARVYTYLTINQGVHGRPLADIIYMLLTGGLFIDFSPLSQIIALLTMTWTGLRLYDVFAAGQNRDENSINIERCAIALVFTVFPLNFGLISYRFDSVSFGLAILSASTAFICATKIEMPGLKAAWRLLFPGLLLACSLALYQAMFGIYACCTIFYLCHLLLQNESPQALWKRFAVFCSVCVTGVLFYLPVFVYTKYMLQFDHFGLGPHPYVKHFSQLPSLTEFPKAIWNNVGRIFSTVTPYIGLDIPSVTLVLVTVIFIGLVLTRKIAFIKKVLVLLALPCAVAVCFGLQIFLAHPIIEPRTGAPLAAFTVCLFVLTLVHLASPLGKKCLLLLFAAFILSSATILSSIGNAQRDQYKFETEFTYSGLEADLMNLYMNDGLKSFYITPTEPPVCTTLQVLKQKYGFLTHCGAMSATVFTLQKIIAYLPINYYLPSLLQLDEDTSPYETVISRYNYSIKKVVPGRFVVVVNDIAVPPFTPERWK